VERRTLPGEPLTAAAVDLRAIAGEVLADDPDVRADVRLLLARPAYAIPAGDLLPTAVLEACATRGCPSRVAGLSFWTDAAVLATRGTRTVLFGPGGAGLHSPKEYVHTEDVVACRDVLVELVSRWNGRA
jgi:acetylornithine deacetylase